MSEISGTPEERQRDAEAVDDALLDAFYGKLREQVGASLRPFYRPPVVSFREFKPRRGPWPSVIGISKDSTLTANEYNADASVPLRVRT